MVDVLLKTLDDEIETVVEVLEITLDDDVEDTAATNKKVRNHYPGEKERD